MTTDIYFEQPYKSAQFAAKCIRDAHNGTHNRGTGKCKLSSTGWSEVDVEVEVEAN